MHDFLPIIILMTSLIIIIVENHHHLDDQADTVNPFDTDVSLRPGNLYANLVLAESEQVFSIFTIMLMFMLTR